MAMARSLALRKAEMNSGTSTGTRLFAFWIRLPVSKSAPRALCAFMILSVSSIRMGMNRSAIDIIMAISCTGTWIFLRKPSPFSIPSVRSFGVVVSVISEEPMTSRIRRITIRMATRMPSFVIFSFHSCHTTVPGVRNKLKTAVISISIKMARNPRTIKDTGTLESRIRMIRNTAASR